MKTAKKVITSVELYCPHCKEIFVSDCGSHYWDVGEIHSNEVQACRDCGKQFKMPVIK